MTADVAATATEYLERLGSSPSDLADVVHAVRSGIAAEVERVVELAAAGEQVFPEVAIADVLADTVPAATRAAVARSGCAIVRATFDREEAEAWDAELGAYLERNAFRARLEAVNPAAGIGARIWGVYWSRPQVAARQHERMVAVRRFLNSIWRHSDNGVAWLDPDHDVGYPDRIRRREPGATARGLPAHVDSMAAGGWRIAENQRVFAPLVTGGLGAYDPWRAEHRGARLDATPTPFSSAMSTVFRTFQGWTALSEMHPDDGGLQVLPVPAAVGYRLLVGLAGEAGAPGHVPEPAPVRDRGDELLARGLVAIPAVAPGDTVWWHGDLFHAVAEASNRTRWGNVMYIGSSPRCPRNDAYRTDMYERFLRGASARDFPAEDFEADFEGRATPADLNAVGRAQFGLT